MPPRIVAKGGANITIFGKGFGVALREAMAKASNGSMQIVNVTVSVGGRKCQNMSVVSDTEIKCDSPPFISRHRSC